MRPSEININGISLNLLSPDWECKLHEWNNAGWYNTVIDFLHRWSNTDNEIEVKTSGSTGPPKQMKVKKEHMVVSAQNTCSFFHLNASSKALLCLSADFIAGQMMLVRALVSGMKLYVTEAQSNPLDSINDTFDFAAMVPLQAEYLTQHPENWSKIKTLIIGGGRTDASLVEKLAKTPISSYETFGMTETLSHIALRQVSPQCQPWFETLDGITVSCNDEQCLEIHYPALGYNKLQTNDIVEIIDSKNFNWLGRKDFIINSGGIKINPESLEELLNPYIKQHFCIIGLPDAHLGEKIVLVLETQTKEIPNWFNDLKNHLPSHHAPREVAFLPSFPLTNNGKLKRAEIKKMLLHLGYK